MYLATCKDFLWVAAWWMDARRVSSCAARASFFSRSAVASAAVQPLVRRAAVGELDGWLGSVRGRLALVLLTDQFPRNIWRGEAAAFAFDVLALRWAKEALRLGLDGAVRPIERVFLYLPLEHSEELADQREAVRLFDALAASVEPAAQPAFAGYLDYARRHLEIVERFGRFPHRNAALGRETSAEEAAFLREPGSGF